MKTVCQVLVVLIFIPLYFLWLNAINFGWLVRMLFDILGAVLGGVLVGLIALGVRGWMRAQAETELKKRGVCPKCGRGQVTPLAAADGTVGLFCDSCRGLVSLNHAR